MSSGSHLMIIMAMIFILSLSLTLLASCENKSIQTDKTDLSKITAKRLKDGQISIEITDYIKPNNIITISGHCIHSGYANITGLPIIPFPVTVKAILKEEDILEEYEEIK